MEPTSDHLLIEVEPVKERTESGLYVQEKWETRPPIGTIKAIGPAVDPKEFKVGRKVLFMRYGATQTHQKDLKLVKTGHVLAFINE